MERLRLIAADNWTQSHDVTLPASDKGELRVPFSRHIHQSNPPTPNRTFPQYPRLPAELQLRVLSHCDKPTLFQLMHTSQSMQIESEKLFFSDPDILYRIGEGCLDGGGDTGSILLHDTKFLARVERIKIDFWWMTEVTWVSLEARNGEEIIVESYENMCRFWDAVRRLFPRVKHVVLGDDHDRGDDPLPTIEYKNLGHLGPSNIEIYIALAVGDGHPTHRMKRKLWLRVKNEGGGGLSTAKSEWKECLDFLRPCVVPPNKAFRGPVGEYREANSRLYEWEEQEQAVRVHKIAAMEKHHFQISSEPSGSQLISLFKPFGCAASDCDAWFERPGEYTSHAIEFQHDKYHDIPEPFKNDFAVNEERLSTMRDNQMKKWRAFCDWWGEYGSEKQDVAKRKFTHQLIHDPLWAGDEPVNEQKVWEAIENDVNGYGEWWEQTLFIRTM
jgi:hypothetical protein